jgi:ADP-ribose pyrophosphatase YjhB (NUDIX family)
VPEWEGRVLLCRRAIEPRYGYWTLPAGFMENGETVAAGAARETLEEAGTRIEMAEAFSMISVPRVNQVHVFFRARVLDLEFRPGRDAGGRAARRARHPVEGHRVPHGLLTLERWFADRRAGGSAFTPPRSRHPEAPRAGSRPAVSFRARRSTILIRPGGGACR